MKALQLDVVDPGLTEDSVLTEIELVVTQLERSRRDGHRKNSVEHDE